MNLTLRYKSSWDCVSKVQNLVTKASIECFFVQTFANEGPLGFYKGFFPNWFRIAPHTVVTMVVFEQFRKITGMRPV